MSFASPTASLALLEILVHTDRETLPADLVIVEADVPDDAIVDLPLAELPRDWRAHPPVDSTRQIGDRWLESAASLGMHVPSVVIRSDAIQLRSIEPFEIDRRLRR